MNKKALLLLTVSAVTALVACTGNQSSTSSTSESSASTSSVTSSTTSEKPPLFFSSPTIQMPRIFEPLLLAFVQVFLRFPLPY